MPIAVAAIAQILALRIRDEIAALCQAFPISAVPISGCPVSSACSDRKIGE